VGGVGVAFSACRNLSLRCVQPFLQTWPGFTAFRSGPGQVLKRAGRKHAYPSSATSSGRLFLDRVGRHQRPSPLHRHTQFNMQFHKPRQKGTFLLCLDTGLFVIESGDVDYQFRAPVVAHRIAHPRPRIRTVPWTIHRHDAERVQAAFIQEDHLIIGLHNLHRVRQTLCARQPAGLALHIRIVFLQVPGAFFPQLAASLGKESVHRFSA
jgi:hypothetical protein